MPCLSIMVKGDDLATTNTFKLRRSLKVKYLKLLHCYHNINATELSVTLDRTQERLIFARFNFLNADNYDNFEENHSYVSLGATKEGTSKSLVVRDLYKVLLDKPVIELRGDLKITLFYLNHLGDMTQFLPADFKSKAEVTSASSGNTNFMNLILEYEEI